MYDIQLNESGTRHLNVTEQNLQTIRKYGLFDGLVGSTGYITEAELDKLKLNIARSSPLWPRTQKTFSTCASMSYTTTR